MRGKAARALRKAINYHPRNDREYFDFTHKVKRSIMQVEPQEDGSIKFNTVERVVEAYTIECISGDRKIYKYLKRKYTNINHEEQFNMLPEQGELDDIQQQFQEDLRAAKRRGVSSENEQDHGSDQQSRESEVESELSSDQESRD